MDWEKVRKFRLALELVCILCKVFVVSIVSYRFAHVNIDPVLPFPIRNKQVKSGKPNQVFRGAYGSCRYLDQCAKTVSTLLTIELFNSGSI